MKFVMTRIPALTKALEIPRAKILARLKVLDHTLDGVVTAETDALVTDAEKGTKKHEDAVTLKVKLMTTAEFLKLLGGQKKVMAEPTPKA